MYCKPKIAVYDAAELTEIQAYASSCSGGSVGVVCSGAEAAAPEVSCTNGSVGVAICESGSIGVSNSN